MNITVTGGSGFLGQHVVTGLKSAGHQVQSLSGEMYDLRNFTSARLAINDADVVVHLAANVGGIGYNKKYPGTLYYDNAMMGLNVVEAARIAGVSKIVAVGTVCSYPKTPRHIPFLEEDLLYGIPELTNAAYGYAKLGVLHQLESYKKQYGLHYDYLILSNLYGHGDNYSQESSHVIPAIINKIKDDYYEEDGITLWGDGTPTRDFLNVRDAARAICNSCELPYSIGIVNIGTGVETSIKEVAHIIKDSMGYRGPIDWDHTKPNGQPRRVLSVGRAREALDFEARIELGDGISQVTFPIVTRMAIKNK